VTRSLGVLTLAAVASCVAWGCTGSPRELGHEGFAADPAGVARVVTRGVCVIQPTALGQGCRGVVRFEVEGDALRIVADVTGLTPGGSHGFHIHELGDLTAPDASSAGAHFALGGRAHGGPISPVKHEGDLGNLVADGRGESHLELLIPGLSLTGPAPVLGRAVIVHAGPDDLRTQPTGGSGVRIGAGVIGIAGP
jgi:superoxide dismutase, Cu-Zn family